MTSKKGKTFGIQEMPYSERQLIVIVPDEVKEAEIKVVEEIQKSEEGKKLKYVEYLEKITDKLRPESVKERIRKNVRNDLLVQWGIEAVKAVKELLKKDIDALTVRSSESTTLTFPPGHPRKMNLYVGHPAAPHVYFPLADFHRMMFESKFSEAITLLMALGAETVNIVRLEGWGYEMSSKIETPLADAEASIEKDKDSSLMFSASLQPTHLPAIPDNLVWYHYEPTWKMIANGRTKYGLKEFSLNVSSKDDFGISMKLKGTIEKAGFGLGSSFQRHVATVWNINGKFADILERKS